MNMEQDMNDIVNRLRFDATRCEATFSKGVAGNITEAADEIERLRRRVKALETFLQGALAISAVELAALTSSTLMWEQGASHE